MMIWELCGDSRNWGMDIDCRSGQKAGWMGYSWATSGPLSLLGGGSPKERLFLQRPLGRHPAGDPGRAPNCTSC